jgi:demethylmacrocin O-methyltransferase
MTLDELALKNTTDKRSVEHNYTQFYETYFEPLRNEELKILEIGIYRPQPNTDRIVGASLKTWYDYFPNSKIYGVDLTDFTDVDNDRITTMICNQSYRENKEDYPGLSSIIEKYGSDFDIIIDDGGHTMEQQMVTLGYMFKHLKLGGIFVIEDLHTSYFAPSSYNPTNTSNTALNVLKKYQTDSVIYSEFMTKDEMDYLNSNINRCDIHKGTISEISFLIKNEKP